jgi:hypothetical protein
LAVIDEGVIRETLGDKFVANFTFLPAVDTRGGAVLAADEDKYKITRAFQGTFTVTAKIEATASFSAWWLTTVYGPQLDNEKLQFLQELRNVRQLVSDNWLVVGDFNMILTAADKNNANLNRRLMGEFRSLVHDLELREISLKGRKFTWSNDSTQTRIDRAFCTTEWECMQPNSVLNAMSSLVSDHCPLLLVRRATMPKYKGFRFESFWPKLPGFQEVVAEAWGRPLAVFKPFLRLHAKLQSTATKLKQWAKSKLGNNKLLMIVAKQLIWIFDVVAEYRQLSLAEISFKRDLKARYLGMAAVEKLRLKQQSRLTMIKATEASEKLFFLRVTGRRRKTYIQRLKHEG